MATEETGRAQHADASGETLTGETSIGDASTAKPIPLPPPASSIGGDAAGIIGGDAAGINTSLSAEVILPLPPIDDVPDASVEAVQPKPLDDNLAPMEADVDEMPAPPPPDPAWDDASFADVDAPHSAAAATTLNPDAEAAALASDSADLLNLPAALPSDAATDVARSASLGFTLELSETNSQPAPHPPETLAGDMESEEFERPSSVEQVAPAPNATDLGQPAEAQKKSDGSAETPLDQAPSIEIDLSLNDFATRHQAHRFFNGPTDQDVDEDDLERWSVGTDGIVLAQVQEVVYSRADLLLSLSGNFEVEVINRRYRGRRTDSLFGGSQHPMVALLGIGVARLDPGQTKLQILRLDDEELYLVEASLVSFSAGLVWENGRLPGEEGEDLDIVHLRGTGRVAVSTEKELRAVRVTGHGPVTLNAKCLVGWNGAVVPSRGAFPGLPENAARPAVVRFEGTGLVLTT